MTSGLCECGCGETTPLAKCTTRSRGMIKGQPIRFVHGHNTRKAERYAIEDRGFSTPCWIWLLATNDDGHGHMTRNGKTRQAHVWMYEDEHGPVPSGLHLHHKCEVPACVNPAHLEPVTPTQHRRLHSRLTEADVQAMRDEYAAGGVFYKDLAARFGMSVPQVCWIIKRKSWA